ncbi:MAG: Ig-like domain-containing protein [Candidatus Diapherotrites archaeon]|uniref:Ig-like domain-containing protein n=1 Tax=Candidatus Iainarchaeum sp. TaxID=3101447 RepID=A0A8T4KXR6_9ARCH|nr:MAG: hypothetical protein QT03_C0001G0306 [archaeon GW2011_AR10]MBS3058864.1 Ig-like domain-containing protein [Candidatus Diapherotrites archaeon]
MNLKFLLALIVLLFFIAGCTSNVSEVQLTVKVINAFSNPVEDARVSLVPDNSNFASRVQNTDEQGITVFTVETGKVQISVSKDGYSTTVVDEMLEDSKTREIVLEQLRR